MGKNIVPLVCNRNSRYHYDYGVPIVNSNDYRTTTGKFHDLHPPNPQEFDCRVKVKLRDDLKFQDVGLKHSSFESTNKNDFVTKYSQTRICDSYRKAPRYNKDYTRNIEEKMFANPPRPIPPEISEMKDNYRINYANLQAREVLPPAISAVCPVQGLGRDEQPPVRPEKQGFWKWLDPYMTTNRCTFITFSKDQFKNAQKDFPTYYNTNGKWKGFEDTLPPAGGNKTIIDKVPFKHQLPNRNMPKIVKRVPHSGITTEYTGNYQINSKSDLAPYIQVSGEEFPDSLSGASAWQELAAPGMYHTEYSQMGTGKSSRNIIAVDKTRSGIVHEPCRFKFTDCHKY